MKAQVDIREMDSNDIESASHVHKKAFVRQTKSNEWLKCSNAAYPKTISYVATIGEQVVGYVLWTQKSGFRPEVVLELEQIAVLPKYHGQGIATKIIQQSLPMVSNAIESLGQKIKHVMVTTRADNFAQELYKKALKAEVEATITNLYSADEVIMVSRHINITNWPT